jgi:glycogen(starch) synthase
VRIAFLTPEFPGEVRPSGGLGTYLQRVTAALLATGHTPEVFVASHETRQLWRGDLLVHRVRRHESNIPVRRRPDGAAAGPRYLPMLADSWALARALRQRHREAPFTIIQAANIRVCGLAASYLCPVPLVTRVSSYRPESHRAQERARDRERALIERTEALQLRRSAAVYAPSRIVAGWLRAREGIAAAVVEPPFWLDQSPGEAPADVAPDSYLLFFGRLGLLKGCDRLIRVLPRLLRREPDLRFYFAGRSERDAQGRPFDRVIERRFRDFGDRVRVWPQLPPAEVLAVVCGARGVVLPSRVDNLPNTCLEAMALGRVVIATHDASFDQVIKDGKNGFLVPQEDDAALARSMERVWRMPPEKREAMGARAAETLRRMEPHAAARDLAAFFVQVAAGPNAEGSTR